MRIAIIPARGGSKRIPRKNIREFRGKPMIGWSIEAALQCGCFDHVVVSTDDEEIANIARKLGAEVPFMRPAPISDDHASTLNVLQHGVQAVEKTYGETLDLGCCLYATAPFVTPENLQQGLQKMLVDASLEFAFTVTRFPSPIQRALKIDSHKRIQMMQPEFEKSRSQDLEETYHDAGQFYWFRRDAVFNSTGFFSAVSAPILLPREQVQDIDTDEDWKNAELAHQLLEKRQA
jgi:N-acylneuraminate cytidylyltransferase